MSRRWTVEDVADLQGDNERFAHVAKHLYNRHEHWEQVIPDLGDARDRACTAGCVVADFRGAYPKGDRASGDCREHVLGDHDEFLAPAYRAALDDAQESRRVARIDDEKTGWACVGVSGVYVVVREVGTKRKPGVKTAYRVIPPGGRGRDPEDFFKAAVRKLRDKTSWNGGGE